MTEEFDPDDPNADFSETVMVDVFYKMSGNMVYEMVPNTLIEITCESRLINSSALLIDFPFIAEVGGLMGMILGASFISLLELILFYFYFIYLACANLAKSVVTKIVHWPYE